MRRVLAATTAVLLSTVFSCGGDQGSSSTGGAPNGGSAESGGSAGASTGGASASTAGVGGMAGVAVAGAGLGGAASSGGKSAAGDGGIAGSGGTSSGGGKDGGAGGAEVGGASGAGGAGAGGSSAGGTAGDVAAGGTAGTGGPRPTVTAEPGTTLVVVDASTHYQTFEGFGTSLCWWANQVGGWSANARNAVVDAIVNPTTGLGYNVFRYNIGGGENPAHDHMGDFKDLPGFQPSAGTWDWNADSNQRAVLQQIVTTGSEIVLEAFSNSPPYWMTKSGCAAGSADGTNNLKDDSYDAFADYLTEVVKHFKDTWGITFRTLEPLNEPNASWWKENNTQEGCHFSPSNQETLIRAVAAKLTQKGLTGTTVSAADENSMDDAYDNARAFAQATLDAISQMNVHSYAGTRRAEMRALATSKAKRLWQSESGPLGQTLANETDAAFFMAGRIVQDLRDLKPNAWVDWQFADASRNWASVALNAQQQTFSPLKRFYVSANFSRYIRPGAVFVDVNDANMVAAVSKDGKSVTLVVRNGDASATKGYTFDLTKLPTVGATAQALRTSRTENLESVAGVAISDYRFVAMIPPSSVTTFVIPMP